MGSPPDPLHETTVESNAGIKRMRMTSTQSKERSNANRLYDKAREQTGAGVAAGPFAGVPFMLEDLPCCRATDGSAIRGTICGSEVANYSHSWHGSNSNSVAVP